MKRHNIFITVLFIAAIILSGCSKNSATPLNEDPESNSSNNDIVFMSKADHKSGELYIRSEDGVIKRLTNNERHENNPAFSYDKSKVAYHAGDEQDPLTWDIYVLDLSTGEETQLTNNNVTDGHPDWSPDGAKILFSSYRDKQGQPSGTADIYVINIDGTNITQLTNSANEDNDAEWSPDGKKIAYKSTENTKTSGREEIFVMDANGENQMRLTETTGWQSDHDPSWSKDSKTIVFERFEGSRPWYDMGQTDILLNHVDQLTPWNLYAVDLEGNLTKLTNTEQGEISFLPVYSPDGESILFTQIDFIEQDGKIIGAYHRFYKVNTDGSGLEQYLPDDEHTYTLEYFDW